MVVAWLRGPLMMAEDAGGGQSGTGGTDAAVLDAPPPGEAAPEPAPVDAPAADLGSSLPALDWRSDLDRTLQEDPTVQQHKLKSEFVKAAIETKRFVGRSLQIPQEDTPEAWAQWDGWSKLGRPESPADYVNPEVDAPEGMEISAEMERQFREAAFASGLSQKQYEDQVKYDAQRWRMLTNEVDAAKASALQEAEVTLAQQFGASAPRLKAAAQQSFELLGNGVWGGEAGTRAYEKIREAGLDNDPDFCVALANFYERMREGQYLVSNEFPAGVQTAGEVEQQIGTLLQKERDEGSLSREEQQKLDGLYEHKQRMLEARREREARL